jgi:hypothetical protein
MMNELAGLELAKYILLRIVENKEGIEQLAKDFDNDVRFITRVIEFLKDVGWIRQNSNGTYQMTDVMSLKVSSSKVVI